MKMQTMRHLVLAASVLAFLTAPAMAHIYRSYYGGGHHTISHGGHYFLGHSSSHRGGHYTNWHTGNHYGRHK